MKKIFINNFINIKWNKKNLITVLIKEILLNKILMLSWFNYTNFLSLFFKSKIIFFSRKKNNFWFKGEYSKNFQFFKIILVDCDLDCFKIVLFQNYNISCHNFYKSCFYNKF